MKIFLDTLHLNEIEKYSKLGFVKGVTTNPTMIMKDGEYDDLKIIKKVRKALGKGEIHIPCFEKTTDKILEHVRKIQKKTKDDNLVFKLPFNDYGLSACSELVKKGIKTNMHVVFSINQAMIAAALKSTYTTILMGRLDDIGLLRISIHLHLVR